MKNWVSKIAYTGLLFALAFVLLQSPTARQSYGTVANQPELGLAESPSVRVVSTLLPTGFQQIVVVDMNAQTMAVYHIEPAQGKIQLKSVRRLVWDLKMEQFNAQSPLPSELRAVQP